MGSLASISWYWKRVTGTNQCTITTSADALKPMVTGAHQSAVPTG